MTGTIGDGGATVANIGGLQFVPPGATANGVNPVASAFVGYWTPNSYASRWVYFQMRPGSAAPTGQQNSLIVQFDVNPETGDPIYAGKFVPTDFGQGISIGIAIPAPGGMTVVGFGAFACMRRRRTSQPVP